MEGTSRWYGLGTVCFFAPSKAASAQAGGYWQDHILVVYLCLIVIVQTGVLWLLYIKLDIHCRAHMMEIDEAANVPWTRSVD